MHARTQQYNGAKLRAQLKRGDEFKKKDSNIHSTLFLLRYVDHGDLIRDLGLVRRVDSQRELSTTSKEEWLGIRYEKGDVWSNCVPGSGSLDF